MIFIHVIIKEGTTIATGLLATIIILMMQWFKKLPPGSAMGLSLLPNPVGWQRHSATIQ